MHSPAATASQPAALERFSYDDDIVRKFVFATMLWGAVGMAVGVLIALQLTMPSANAHEWHGQLQGDQDAHRHQIGRAHV